MIAFPDLHRLRAFVVVADELNFHRAAARLNMAQSPLSRLVKKLEDELGVALFQRSRNRVALTVAGQHLVPRAHALLDSAAHLLTEVRSFQQSVGDELGDRRRLNRQTMVAVERRSSVIRSAARFNMSDPPSNSEAENSK